MLIHFNKIVIVLSMVVLTTTACSMTVSQATPTPTTTPTEIFTETPLPTTTSSPIPTQSATPTLTPTSTDTPTITPIPSNTPLPTSTPGIGPSFTSDNWQLLELPTVLTSGLPEPYVVFLTLNDRDKEGLVSTPQPATGVQSLYFSPSQNRAQRIEVLQLPESTGDRVYVSPSGDGVVYFIESGSGIAPGLYMLNMSTGVSSRILPIETLVQRGFFSTPIWASDGSQFALMLATAYATDIFLIQRDGSAPVNVTASGSYDLYPTFSPDGQQLAFLSDRERCPSWIPEQPNTCDGTNTQPSDGGHLYVLDLASGNVTKRSEIWLTSPPKWINNRQITYAQGDPLLGDTERILWVTDVVNGTNRQIRPVDGNLIISEAWSPNGSRLFYQTAGAETQIVLVDSNGDLIASTGDFNYPRYGMSASWSPDGSKIAVGGVSGQCPFGSTVIDAATFSLIARGNPPPSMCAPQYSPDGTSIVFLGVSLNDFDGRSDIFVANANGFGTVNLTGDLRGTMRLLGWAGGIN